MPRRTAAALLERERELATCRDGFAQARAGAGSLTLIEGPAGVGKTELTRAARAAAEHAGLTALEATGSELEQPFAFGVVRQLLEPALDGAADPFAGAAGPAARLFARDQREERADAGFEALHSLYWLVVNLADQAPLLMLVDDCHWVDRDSLRFLAFLAQRIEGLPVAMLLAGRPPVDEPGSVWGQVAARAAAVALYPRPLSESAVVSLARERLGADAADEFCRACHTATGGNPLFLRELLNAVDAARIAPSAAAASEVQAVGPAAVRRFVLHRLATLGPEANELARAVAVLGDDTELPLAAGVAQLGEEVAAGAADDLVRADIFVQDARLGFVHPIVRAALYEDLAPGERGTRHAAAAAALADAGASPERITAHLLLTPATGDRRRIATLRSAAAAAARGGAPAAAAERLRRALAESPAERERGEILAELGGYDVAAMRFDAAEEHLRAALASGTSLTTRADAAVMLARCAIVSGDGRTAEAAVDALAALGDELRPLDPERSLELGSALLMVTTAVVPMRTRLGTHLQRFTEAARGHPGFEAVGRIHGAHERVVAGGSAAAAVEETEAALAAGLPPSAATGAAFLALQTLRLGGRYDMTMRMLDAGHGGRPPRGPCDPAGTDPRPARRARARAGRAQGRPDRGGDRTARGRRAALRGAATARDRDRRRRRARGAGCGGRAGASGRRAGDRGGSHVHRRVPHRPWAPADRPGPGRGGRRGPALVRRAARGAARALAERLAGVRGPVPGGGGRRGGRRAARPRAARRRPRRRRAP